MANWLPGGESDPAYAHRYISWGYGSAVCLGVAVIAAIWWGRRGDARAAAAPAVADERSSRFTLADALISLGAFVLYAVIARTVFSGRPLLIDEIVQMLQARMYVAGHLWVPVAAHREFYSILHVVDTGDKVYSQFPPGGPAMLALGELVHVPWLVGPACGAISVALFSRLLKLTDPQASRAFHVGATLLFAVTPFGAFMFGSHMNHATTLMWLMLSTVALGLVASSPAPRIGWAFVNGLGLGVAATIRPLDAFAFALPAAAWLLVLAWRDKQRWSDALASGAGVAIPFIAMMYVNAQTTGSPLLFGYEVLWGKAHGLGFHAAPWGDRHTPSRGVELISLYVTRLQSYLFETPFPAMLPVIGGLALTKRLSAVDRYLLVSATLLGAFYFAYWHDGFFLGPRFVFPWLPVLVLYTARLPRLVRERFGRGRIWAGTNAALASGAVMAVAFSLPVRVIEYQNGLTSMRDDYTAESAAAGVHDALVFVRESWGAQLMARMWARGISRSASAALYHGVDACLLDKGIREIETRGLTGATAEARLEPLLADSARVRPSPWSPDSTEKVLQGARYDETCVARINQDRRGFTHLAPLLLERGSGNVYARDLQASDSLITAEYPARPVYLLRRKDAVADSAFEWIPLRRDSLVAAWRSGRP
ncbi:MAG TPA: hypothetical protein VN613_07120 [Gemmatimonadaceae bacterium]|nr:hypothetical protein [Gemmatimonadaceae bacterium]